MQQDLEERWKSSHSGTEPACVHSNNCREKKKTILWLGFVSGSTAMWTGVEAQVQVSVQLFHILPWSPLNTDKIFLAIISEALINLF